MRTLVYAVNRRSDQRRRVPPGDEPANDAAINTRWVSYLLQSSSTSLNTTPEKAIKTLFQPRNSIQLTWRHGHEYLMKRRDMRSKCSSMFATDKRPKTAKGNLASIEGTILEGIANFQEERDALHRVQRNATKQIHGLENKLFDIRLKELNSDYQRESGEPNSLIGI
ncbi:hypothetical protein DUI87_05671 [Hirundo rustica rustica]|uniref:Uncharacterized protein n=1 Tax=Hirundo rustica rustica TaxID=333673 RepID=A0A3M0L017_HIRRU|nr:hypothetical protein DUI87_05671 [Hirundo rustica rustica]